MMEIYISLCGLITFKQRNNYTTSSTAKHPSVYQDCLDSYGRHVLSTRSIGRHLRGAC